MTFKLTSFCTHLYQFVNAYQFIEEMSVIVKINGRCNSIELIKIRRIFLERNDPLSANLLSKEI
jgi:hypothetical protein